MGLFCGTYIINHLYQIRTFQYNCIQSVLTQENGTCILVESQPTQKSGLLILTPFLLLTPTGNQQVHRIYIPLWGHLYHISKEARDGNGSSFGICYPNLALLNQANSNYLPSHRLDFECESKQRHELANNLDHRIPVTSTIHL